MAWIAYALLGTLLMTIINYGDKFVVESQVRRPYAVPVLMSWVNLGFSLILWGLAGWRTLSGGDALLLLIAGTGPAFGGYFYFQAVQRAETSRIVVLSQMAPLFILILSVVFFGERLTLIQLAGFALILLAALRVTMLRVRTRSGELPAPPAWDVLLLLVASNMIIAIAVVLSDFVLDRIAVDTQSLMLTLVYTSWGYGLGGFILLLTVPRVRRALLQQLPELNMRAGLSLASVEIVFVIRQFVLFAAYAIGPAALISVIGSLNVFFAIFAGLLLTLWQPAIFKEDIRRETLLRKMLWAGVAFAGLILLR